MKSHWSVFSSGNESLANEDKVALPYYVTGTTRGCIILSLATIKPEGTHCLPLCIMRSTWFMPHDYCYNMLFVCVLCVCSVCAVCTTTVVYNSCIVPAPRHISPPLSFLSQKVLQLFSDPVAKHFIGIFMDVVKMSESVWCVYLIVQMLGWPITQRQLLWINSQKSFLTE